MIEDYEFEQSSELDDAVKFCCEEYGEESLNDIADLFIYVVEDNEDCYSNFESVINLYRRDPRQAISVVQVSGDYSTGLFFFIGCSSVALQKVQKVIEEQKKLKDSIPNKPCKAKKIKVCKLSKYQDVKTARYRFKSCY